MHIACCVWRALSAILHKGPSHHCHPPLPPPASVDGKIWQRAFGNRFPCENSSPIRTSLVVVVCVYVADSNELCGSFCARRAWQAGAFFCPPLGRRRCRVERAFCLFISLSGLGNSQECKSRSHIQHIHDYVASLRMISARWVERWRRWKKLRSLVWKQYFVIIFSAIVGATLIHAA